MSARITITDPTPDDRSTMGRAPAIIFGLILLIVGLTINPALTIVVAALVVGWRRRVGEARRTEIAAEKFAWGNW